MTITVKIIRGDETHTYLNNANFLQQWENLAANTPHVTAFQEIDFVCKWYEHYHEEFEPILVIGESTTGELLGLIPLAIEKGNSALTNAGAWLAEYSGWLSKKEHTEQFMINALKLLKETFNFSCWNWTYIAPMADVSWFDSKELKKHGINILSEKIDSPVLDLQNEEKLKKVLKNKSVKSKINRLKRKGDLRIERITSKDHALELMDDVSNLVNFRHEAAHDDAAFEDDHLQRGFYEKRSENLKDNHFSVLWMGEKLLAFHFGYVDKDSIYIGLTAFDPTESKHSPGVIFLIYLANLLKDEGIRYIDLTPGGDEYKERFSNKHNVLQLPTVYASKLQFQKALATKQAKRFATNSLELIGIDKQALQRKLQKNKPKEKINIENFDIYSIDVINFQSQRNISSINIQKYSDLLNYKQADSHINRQQIVSDATYRFSREEIIFTLNSGDILEAYAWLTKPGAKYTKHGCDYDINKSEVVLDCLYLDYSHPNHESLIMLIEQMLHFCNEKELSKAYIFINASNSSQKIQESLQLLGFSKV